MRESFALTPPRTRTGRVAHERKRAHLSLSHITLIYTQSVRLCCSFWQLCASDWIRLTPIKIKVISYLSQRVAKPQGPLNKNKKRNELINTKFLLMYSYIQISFIYSPVKILYQARCIKVFRNKMGVNVSCTHSKTTLMQMEVDVLNFNVSFLSWVNCWAHYSPVLLL